MDLVRKLLASWLEDVPEGEYPGWGNGGGWWGNRLFNNDEAKACNLLENEPPTTIQCQTEESRNHDRRSNNYNLSNVVKEDPPVAKQADNRP